MKLFAFFLFLHCLCLSVYSEDNSVDCLVLVGHKISVTMNDSGSMKIESAGCTLSGNNPVQLATYKKNKFTCKYQIVRLLCGEYLLDSIEFEAFSEYQIPSFAKFENTLFVLRKNSTGGFSFMQYYAYDVYRTKDDKWACIYSHPANSFEEFASYSVKLKFEKNPYFDISNLDKVTIQRKYPSPFYRIEKSIAVPMSGIYVEDLIDFIKQRLSCVKSCK